MKRSLKKIAGFGDGGGYRRISPPLGKRMNIIEKVEGLSLVDASFAPRDSPRPLKKNWLCHPPPVVMGVSMIPNIHPLTGYCERHSWGRKIRGFNVNQSMCPVVVKPVRGGKGIYYIVLFSRGRRCSLFVGGWRVFSFLPTRFRLLDASVASSRLLIVL